MANIGSLVVSLSARTTDLEKGLDKARKDLRKAHGTIDRLNKNIDRMGDQSVRTARRFGTAFARMRLGTTGLSTSLIGVTRGMRGLLALVGAGLGVAFVRQTLTATDALGKMADRLNISVEALQEFRFAASQSGIEQRTLELGFQRIIRRAQDAVNGNTQLAQSFANVGLSLTELRNFSNEQIFTRAITGAAQLTDRLAAMQKIADTEGVALVNLGRLGEQGLERLRHKARELGLVLDTDMVRNAEAANDQLDIMQQVLSVQITRAVVTLAPQITALGNAIARVVKALVSGTDELAWLSANEQQAVATIRALKDAFGGLWDQAKGAYNEIAKLSTHLGQKIGEAPFLARISDLTGRIQTLQAQLKTLPQTGAGTPQVGGPPSTGMFPGVAIAEAGTLLPDRAALEAKLVQLNSELARWQEGLNRLRDTQPVSLLGGPARTEKPERMTLPDVVVSSAVSGEARYKEILAQLTAQQQAATSSAKARIATYQAQTRQLVETITAEQMFRQEIAQHRDALEAEGQALTDSVLTPLERYQASLERNTTLLGQQAISQTMANRVIKHARQRYRETTLAGQALAIGVQGINDAIGQSFQGIIQGTQSVAGAFQNMVRSILLSLGKLLVQRGLMMLVGSILGGGSGAGSGMFGRVFQGGGSSSGLAFGQDGGIVKRPTLTFLGEHGPEAVVPLGRSRGNQPLPGMEPPRVTIINVPDQASADREARDATDRGEQVIVNAVINALRGGQGAPIVRTLHQVLR